MGNGDDNSPVVHIFVCRAHEFNVIKSSTYINFNPSIFRLEQRRSSELNFFLRRPTQRREHPRQQQQVLQLKQRRQQNEQRRLEQKN